MAGTGTEHEAWADIGTWRATVQRLQVQVERWRSEAQRLQVQVERLEADNVRLGAREGELEGQVVALKQTVATLSQQLYGDSSEKQSKQRPQARKVWAGGWVVR